MKRKLTACILAGALTLSLAVPALAADASSGTAAADGSVSLGESKPSAQYSVLYYGKVAEIRRDENGTMKQLVMESEAYGDYIMNLSDQVVWIDSGNHTASDPSTLQEGEGIYVFHSSASTQSLPPQSAAQYPPGYHLRPLPCGGGSRDPGGWICAHGHQWRRALYHGE